ncbi:nucleotidyl transferase AbiEii/AbiGii toxin family protein [Kribbella sp. CA-245084]|uniref:nucleotidyl transferase AbiEii/AbiGii toxin family protein n=1 Tax=Kribbella sp. CA-245084 TaxID=3239940 RepID=UPI003D8F4BBB
MDAEHAQVARIGLSAIRDDGYALAGGQAYKEHGIGVRTPEDVDLFTDRQGDFDQTMGRLQSAYRDEGYQVDVLEHSGEHAKLSVSRDGRSTQVDIGRDFRSRPPVETEVGPMLSVEDSVGSKVGAAYDRAEAKHFIDLEAAVQSGRYSRDDLLALGDERELSGIDREGFAYQLDQAGRIPDAKYAEHGFSAEQTAALKHDLGNWAQQIRTRASNPDVDNAMRVTETGQARAGSGAASQTQGAAARRGASLNQERTKGERGS